MCAFSQLTFQWITREVVEGHVFHIAFCILAKWGKSNSRLTPFFSRSWSALDDFGSDDGFQESQGEMH